MSKSTKTAAKIREIDLLLEWLPDAIERGVFKYEDPETIARLERRVKRLEREKDRLLNPPPPKPRKPTVTASGSVVATFTPGVSTNTHERRGRGKK